MTEEELKQIDEQTRELNSKLMKMYNRYSWKNEFKAPKQEILSLHDEIVEKRIALSLICFDRVLAYNVRFNYDEEYYEILKQDLNNIMEIIVEYINPIVDDAYKNILKHDWFELCYGKYKYNIFGNKFLSNCFDDILGTLLRKNGCLESLYYRLPKELMNEELTSKLYKLLSAHELAFAYYANELYEKQYFFWGNEMTDQIFIELANRSSEEIFTFIKDIMKIPCTPCIGIIGGFIHLRKKYTHEELINFINNLKLPGEDKVIDLMMIHECCSLLEIAEEIIPSLGDISSFEPKKKSLKTYIK